MMAEDLLPTSDPLIMKDKYWVTYQRRACVGCGEPSWMQRHNRFCSRLCARVSSPGRRTHGLTQHPLYGTWNNMLQRCENPKAEEFHNYGGRGIIVCPEWHDVRNFIDWIMDNLGPRPEGYSLDRIETYHGNYGPGEVRWADALTQTNNRRVPGGCPIQCDDCTPADCPPGTKICTTCGETEGPKDISEFYRRTRGGFMSECKECTKARSAQNAAKRFVSDWASIAGADDQEQSLLSLWRESAP